MRLKLKKVGNSSAILITKEMKRYLGLEADEVELDYAGGTISIRKPSRQWRPPLAVKETAKRLYSTNTPIHTEEPEMTDEELDQLKERFPFLRLFEDVPDEVIDLIEQDIKELKKEGFPRRGRSYRY